MTFMPIAPYSQCDLKLRLTKCGLNDLELAVKVVQLLKTYHWFYARPTH